MELCGTKGECKKAGQRRKCILIKYNFLNLL